VFRTRSLHALCPFSAPPHLYQASTSYTAVTHPEDHHPTSYLAKIESHSNYLINAYTRPPLILSHGKGSCVYDIQGRNYLDFSAGIAVNALGHADELLASLAGEQAAKLVHTSNVWYNEWAGELAKLLVETTRVEGGLGLAKEKEKEKDSGGAKVFFSSSGTEANEAAIKFARKYAKETWANALNSRPSASASVSWEDSPKTRIVCFTDAFHGRTMGALSATSNPKYQLPFTPLIPGFDLVQFGDAEAAKGAITDDTCAVLVEPIQGEGGVNEASLDFLRVLRKECDRVGAVLIFDEIQVSQPRSHSHSHSPRPRPRPRPCLCLYPLPPYFYANPASLFSPSLSVRSLPYRSNVGPLHLPDRHPPGHCHDGKATSKRLPHRGTHGP
jgi:acetylornithine aminotransferase